jgi:hypothetical protein
VTATAHRRRPWGQVDEPKTVEAKSAVDSQAAVQVEAKSKVMCGGFASVKTAIAADMTVIAVD